MTQELAQEHFAAYLFEQCKCMIDRKDNLHGIRKKAWEKFIELGLPTKDCEAYKSIRLSRLFSRSYQMQESVTLASSDLLKHAEESKIVLVFVNGIYQPNLSCL